MEFFDLMDDQVDVHHEAELKLFPELRPPGGVWLLLTIDKGVGPVR